MNRSKCFPYILGTVVTILIVALCLYVCTPAIHIRNPGLWFLADLAVFVFILTTRLARSQHDFGKVTVVKKTGSKGRTKSHTELHFGSRVYLIPLAGFLLTVLLLFIGSAPFNATAYSQILTVTESDFSADLSESLGTDSIALMDTASAQMLGDREIGSLSDVVSQFDVASDYTQIDYNGKPVKVSPLRYAGFFKWMNNRVSGIKGYVTVDPVSMSASFQSCEGMKYVPSAWFGEDAWRYLWWKYPTLMMENLHFEIDEEGNPYYVASVVDKTVSLFGGKTVTGCVTLDPVTGNTAYYSADEISNWIDVVFHGDLICTQYNWYGMYHNGFFNSLFAKQGCKQVTTYYISEEDAEDESDEVPVTDYGYVAKDGDIWIYTGITSVNGDSSNIGFLLANERTGEARYYAIAGADERSAMSAAEGEVQEKGYQASFPSLINIDGHPTYIMVLKDSGGLVKLYATVNVEQYNIVTTAATQAECIRKYRAAMGIEEVLPTEAEKEASFTVAAIRYIDIDGNTYIYLIDTQDNIYKAKASDHEEMLLLKEGDQVQITYTGNLITACRTVG